MQAQHVEQISFQHRLSKTSTVQGCVQSRGSLLSFCQKQETNRVSQKAIDFLLMMACISFQATSLEASQVEIAKISASSA